VPALSGCVVRDTGGGAAVRRATVSVVAVGNAAETSTSVSSGGMFGVAMD
jgi:hypothetical protein